MFFVIFVFSGLIKWIKIWPIDPTALFGGLALVVLTARLGISKGISFKRKEVIFLGLFLLFSIWIYISFSYSISEGYSIVKATNYFLIIISFAFPILNFKSESEIRFFLSMVGGVGLLISIVLYYLYVQGGMNLYTLYFHAREGGNKLGIPDYLALGVPVGLSMLIFILRKGLVSKFFALFALGALIMLAGRGPILAVLLVLIVAVLYRFKLTKSTLKYVFIAPLFLIFGAYYFSNWQGSDRLVERVERSNSKDESLTGRVYQLEKAGKLAMEHPILGIGLGSFGLYLLNKDMRAYPHNMIMEVLVEQGLVGLFLLLILLFGIYFWNSRYHVHSEVYVIYASSFCLLYLFINILKSSSLIDNRPFFMFLALVVSVDKLYRQRAY